MSGLLENVGIRQRDAARMLADLLAVSHRPVTLMFRDTFGIDLRPVPARTGSRGLDDSEASLLDAPAGKPCRWRAGRLETASGHLAAGVFFLWIPGRLPAAINGALDAALEPAGAVLDRMPGGMYREDLRAVASDRLDEITGETRSVASRAILVAGGRRVAYAEENFMREFVENLR
jgi:hypothetical protein